MAKKKSRQPAAPLRRRGVSPVWALLLVVCFIGIAAMPREEYIADPMAVRCETVSLIEHGTLALPAELNQQFGGERGEYFFENDAKQKWYCKYGILNSLMYVPVLLVEKWHDGNLSYVASGRAIYLNWFNLFLSLATAFYLYRLALRYTAWRSVAFAFVLTAFYSTYWWNYLRAQNSEIYQALFMLGFFYHLTSTLALPGGPPGELLLARKRRGYLFAGAFLGALILVKTVYVVAVPFAFLALLYALTVDPASGFSAKSPRTYLSYLRPAIWLGLPIAAAAGVLLAVNAYKFGSPFETGYGQWQERGQPIFSGHILTGLFGFLFDPKCSLFLYFPILVFAFFGYRKFWRAYRLDMLLFLCLGGLLLLLYSKMLEWRGGWGYGPRYMLSVLPLLSLPFVSTLEFLWTHWRKWWAACCALAVAFSLFCSFYLQMNANALPFFTYYRLQSLFGQLHDPEIDRYFLDRTFGSINSDLLAYKAGRPWRVLELAAPRLDADSLAKVKQAVRFLTLSNYYFWPDAPDTVVYGPRH